MRKILSLSLICIILLYSFFVYCTITTSISDLALEPTQTPRTRYLDPQLSGNNSASQQKPSSMELQSSTSLAYRTFGGSGYDAAYSIVHASDYGYAMAGFTNSFGSGQFDAWLVKTDVWGNLQWNKAYGGSNDDYSYSIVQSSDNGFVLVGGTISFGSGEADLWIIKTDAFGNKKWDRTYGGIWEDEGHTVIETSDGGLVIAGWTASFGSGSGDFWLVKTNNLGYLEWNKTYGGIYYEAAWDIAQTPDDGFAVLGTVTNADGSSDVWLVRTDRFGNKLWDETYGGTGNENGYSLAQTFDNGFAIAGSTSSFGAGIYDYWLIRTDGSGTEEWNKTYGGTGYDEAWSVLQTMDAGFELVGWTESFGSGHSDGWFVRTDASGNLQTSAAWGGSNYDYAYSIAQISPYAYAVAGETSSFGAGSYDALLIVIWPDPPLSGRGGGGGGNAMPLRN